MTDWQLYFVPALRGALWTYPGFYSPPWAVPILWVLARLPMWAVIALSIVCTVLMAVKKLKPWPAFLFLTCPATIYGIGLVNVDWIVLAGVLCPSWLAVYCYAIKPHLGWLAILRRWRACWLLVLAILVSLPWWSAWLATLPGVAALPEQSIAPWGLLALPLVWQEPIAAGLLFAPHLSYSSYMLLAYGLARRRPWALLVVNLIAWAWIVS